MRPSISFYISRVMWTRGRSWVFLDQGESNALRGHNDLAEAEYACAIRALITDWRLKFAGGHDLAFHSTLLAPINTLWGFAGIRLGQQAQLNMSNAGMASAIDAGDPSGPWDSTLHPRDKQTLGARLSLVARALTYGEEATLTHEGPRMASLTVANTTSGTTLTVTATISFVMTSLGATAADRRLVLGPPVASTRQTCLAGEIPTLCGYYDIKYFLNGSGSVAVSVARAVASLSADKQQLILTATAVPTGATLLSVEALNNEWPVVTVYNSAGLPMYPFAHVLATVPPPPPPPPPRPQWCITSDESPCAGPPQLPLSQAVVCGGGYKLASHSLLGAPPSNSTQAFWSVEAVHVRTNTTSVGGHAVGVLYNATATGTPGHLVASSAPVPVPAGLDGWLRLPLTSVQQVVEGTYFIGYLLDKDQGCFAPGTGSGKDVYSINGWPTPSAVWGPDNSGGSSIDAYATVLPLRTDDDVVATNDSDVTGDE